MNPAVSSVRLPSGALTVTLTARRNVSVNGLVASSADPAQLILRLLGEQVVAFGQRTVE